MGQVQVVFRAQQGPQNEQTLSQIFVKHFKEVQPYMAQPNYADQFKAVFNEEFPDDPASMEAMVQELC